MLELGLDASLFKELSLSSGIEKLSYIRTSSGNSEESFSGALCKVKNYISFLHEEDMIIMDDNSTA